MADDTAVAGAEEPDDDSHGQETQRLSEVTGDSPGAGEQPVSRDPLGPEDFVHWPVAVGRVRADRDTTFVYSPEKAGYSVDEFLDLPVDDRAELWDGVVVLRPELAVEHQAVADELFKELCQWCPKGLIPFNGRLDVRVGVNTLLRPDMQVLSREGDDAPRVLVVAALPDRDMWFRQRELNVKRLGYLQARAESFWAFDPGGSSVAVYELKYQKRGEFKSEEICGKAAWNHWGLWGKTG